MMMRLSTILVASILANACVPDAPESGDAIGGDDGSGGGGGGGDGTGSGSGSGSGGGGGGGITATAFLAGMAQKFCDEAFTCKSSFPTDEGVTFDQAFGASAAACVTDAETYDMPAQVEAQITAGKIQFNGTDAATCVNGITFGTCATFWSTGPDMPAACDTAMVGTVADGQACVVDYECSGASSYCDPTAKKCTPDATGARTTPGFDRAVELSDLI